MKKVLLFCAMLPMMVLAQNVQEIYANLPKLTTEDIIADYNNAQEVMYQYQQAQTDLKTEMRRINNVLIAGLQQMQLNPNIVFSEVADPDQAAKVNRINELRQQMGVVPAAVNVDVYSFMDLKEKYDEEYASYEERVQVIDNELKNRIGHVDNKFGYIETPDYAKEYFDRMNVIADEYNQIYMPKWEEQLMPEINRVGALLDADIPAFAEMISTFETLTDAVAQAKAVQTIMQVAQVQQLFKSYLELYAERLTDIPHMYYKVPDYINGI